MFDKSLQFNGKENYVKIDAAGQGKDFDAHFDKNKGMTICAWVKVIKTGTDTHGQSRQPIVMKGAGGAWEFALYVYDNLAPACRFGPVLAQVIRNRAVVIWGLSGITSAEPIIEKKASKSIWMVKRILWLKLPVRTPPVKLVIVLFSSLTGRMGSF